MISIASNIIVRADTDLGPDAADDVLVEGLAAPRSSQNRPGYIAPRVAAACAITAGW